jgi:DNA-directed RNA polymerase subunit F
MMTGKSKKEERMAPWIPGIIDTMVGARLMWKSAIPHRNRLAVILLDSALETAFRAFLKYKEKITLSDAHKRRENLVKTVKAKAKDIDNAVWDILDFNYTEIRCDFYHQSASKTITDDSFLDYQEVVEFVIDRLLGIRSGQMVKSQALSLPEQGPDLKTAVLRHDIPAIHSVTDKTDKVLVAIASLSPKNVDEVNEFFKKAGEPLRLTNKEFTNMLARNSGTKKFFYHNKELKVWELSGMGEFKLGQIKKENYYE